MTGLGKVRASAIAMARVLRKSPKVWDARASILEMKSEGSRHWKQMEWMGFYFEHLGEKLLRKVASVPGPRYGRTGFDALCEVPWDFKTHAINTSAHQVIVNDREAVEAALRKYGYVGVILALGEVEYNDRKRTFQAWHSKLKGGISAYERARKARGAWSRLRKTSFALKEICFIVLSKKDLGGAGSFQTNFRNSNGNPRRGKVLIDLECLTKDQVVHRIRFGRAR